MEYADNWRQTLLDLIGSHPDPEMRSLRAVSKKAGFAAGYVHSILKPAKDSKHPKKEPRSPSIEAVIAIMRALDQPIVRLFEEPGKTEARHRLIDILGRLEQDDLRVVETVAAGLLERREASRPGEPEDQSGTS